MPGDISSEGDVSLSDKSMDVAPPATEEAPKTETPTTPINVAPPTAPTATATPITTPAAPPPPPIFDEQKFAAVMKEALTPLIPKPVEPPKLWEGDDFINDMRTYREAHQKWQEHNISEYHKKEVAPYFNQMVQRLQQLEQMVPMLYASRAENPAFSQVQTRAQELTKSYNIPWGTALQMAQDEVQKTGLPKTNVRPVPPHASGPNTSALSNDDVKDKGKADFGDIIREIKTSGKW